MKKLLPILLMIAGCANEPIIDTHGVDQAKYERDLAECKSFSEQVSVGKEAVEHGAIGAAVGAVFGAVLGDSSSVGRGAGAGAVSGGTGGATEAERRKERIVFRCLKGRGYKVLG